LTLVSASFFFVSFSLDFAVDAAWALQQTIYIYIYVWALRFDLGLAFDLRKTAAGRFRV